MFQIADMIGNNVWRGVSFLPACWPLFHHPASEATYSELGILSLPLPLLTILWHSCLSLADRGGGVWIQDRTYLAHNGLDPFTLDLFDHLCAPETIFTFLLSVSAWMAARIVKREGLAVVVPAFLWGIFFAGGIWLKGTARLAGTALSDGPHAL
jgi:hypothetical protein